MKLSKFNALLKEWNVTVDALVEVYSILGYNPSIKDIVYDFEKAYLTVNHCRNGRLALWLMYGVGVESCIYIDTLQELSEKEIEEQLL